MIDIALFLGYSFRLVHPGRTRCNCHADQMKLLVYDLRNLETLYSILSFIALGAILLTLLTSSEFWYAREDSNL